LAVVSYPARVNVLACSSSSSSSSANTSPAAACQQECTPQPVACQTAVQASTRYACRRANMHAGRASKPISHTNKQTKQASQPGSRATVQPASPA
jgi:hypothetical protein